MSDTNERSVASAGSGSGLPADMIRPEWMELARAVTFFGVPLERLSRDELMANIGYLLTQVEGLRMQRSRPEVLKERHTGSW
jgi:hypothetical protein